MDLALVLVIDGNNMAYRARYAYDLSYRGYDVSVMYGVMRMLQALLSKYKPNGIIFCWDGGVPDYRKRLVPQYKANRKSGKDGSHEQFVSQMVELETMMPHFGILQLRRIGIEADDLIYHASHAVQADRVMIVTSDDDLTQAVTETVSIIRPRKGRDEIITQDDILYRPEDYVEWKALQGDSSDNIPGVKGVGPKTADKIMRDEPISDRLAAKVSEYYESGAFDRAYACIDLSGDWSGSKYVIAHASYETFSNSRCLKWCMGWGFTSIIEAGSMAHTFGRLECPRFKMNPPLPRVWDYKRCPADATK